MMKKLMRHIAATGVSAAVVGGALLAGGGSAVAAGSQTAGHTAARTPVTGTVHHVSEHRAGRPHVDPWVADQLAWFYPSAAKRLAVYDPWVKDQLALFTPAAGTRAG